LVLKVTYFHYSLILEYIVVFLVDLGPCLIFAPMLPTEFKIMAPSWAIFGVPAHLISPST
jgi:hypothetical protein